MIRVLTTFVMGNIMAAVITGAIKAARSAVARGASLLSSDRFQVSGALGGGV